MTAGLAQLHQPRLAEIVADTLRARILDGDLQDGALLPNQETLLAEFGVSKPSLRQALRILETEGLITVRRGNVGGAQIHRPQARHAAYTMALVLQARHVSIDDVGAALKELESTCAGLCAGRVDRANTVVPELRECNERAAAAMDDELAYVQATADFHRRMVSGCGNETMRLLVGSLEAVWLTHVEQWAKSTSKAGTFPDRPYRLRGLRTHERLTALIEKGDVAKASNLAEEHFEPKQFYSTTPGPRARVSANALRAPMRLADVPSRRDI